MKILMVASEEYFSLQKKRVFEALGHEVLFLDERREYLVPARWGKARRLRKLVKIIRPLKYLSKKALNFAIRRAATAFRPDLFYTEKGKLIHSDTLAFLKRQDIPTANWFPDDLQEFDWVREHAGEYQYFFSFDSLVVERLKAAGLPNVHYLPFGVTPETYSYDMTEEERSRFACDVAFVGARYPEREAALAKLANYDLKIWGWEQWQDSPLKEFYQGRLAPTDVGKVFQAARININVHFASEGHGANVRTFEIPAAGGFELVSYRKDIPDLFEPGTEIDVFKDEDEMLRKVEFYLAHDTIRVQAAQAGHARVLRDHTYRARLQHMLDIIFG